MYPFFYWGCSWSFKIRESIVTGRMEKWTGEAYYWDLIEHSACSFVAVNSQNVAAVMSVRVNWEGNPQTLDPFHNERVRAAGL